MSLPSLLRLIEANDVQGVQGFLASDSGCSCVNEVDENGFSPLFRAVDKDEAIVEALLKAGADANFTKVEAHEGGVFDPEFLEMLQEQGQEIPEALIARANLPTPPKEQRKTVLQFALKNESPAVPKLLHAYGADFSVVDSNGYTSVLHAVFGYGDRLPMIEYLIGLGLDLNGVSSYGESAVKVSLHHGKFEVLKVLLAAGADEEGLEWTPLIRAVAVGTREEVETELRSEVELNAKDVWGDAALHVALYRGQEDIVQLLLDRGADLNEPGQLGASALSFAVRSHDPALVEKLVRLGCFVDGRDSIGSTCLTIATEMGDLPMVRLLLNLGADPNVKMDYSTVLGSATDREIIILLLERGADPADLTHEGRRSVLRLGEIGIEPLHAVTPAEYASGKHPREGKTNPEEVTEPFWVAMIQAGVNAYGGRMQFDDEPDFSCRIRDDRSQAVWCENRFGQTLTMLPDGRIVLIAGEHEDSYDPDFCIYNDVIVQEPDGSFRIFLYPDSIFPPTDFHSATLVGSSIYIVGSLGYFDARTGPIPVYRLSTENYQIEPLTTTGAVPNRIYKHRAILESENAIRIEGGKEILSSSEGESLIDNEQTYRLDLEKMIWAKEDR